MWKYERLLLFILDVNLIDRYDYFFFNPCPIPVQFNCCQISNFLLPCGAFKVTNNSEPSLPTCSTLKLQDLCALWASVCLCVSQCWLCLPVCVMHKHTHTHHLQLPLEGLLSGHLSGLGGVQTHMCIKYCHFRVGGHLTGCKFFLASHLGLRKHVNLPDI